MLSLVKNQFGNYMVQQLEKSSNPVVDTSAYEAYTGGTKTTLATKGDIGTETEKLLQRELPGQTELVIDPETGQAVTKQSLEQKQVEVTKPISTVGQPVTGQDTGVSTALQKAEKIAGLTKRPATSGPSLEDLRSVFQPQQLSTKDKLINTALQVGGDLATKYFAQQMGISTTPIYTGGGINPYSTGTSGTGGIFSGAGGAGIFSAGATLLSGGSTKEAAATGVGTAIGTAVGGPIGGAIGGTIGSIVGCFLPDTLITMSDGSHKKIIDIDIKDNIEVGGLVFATGKFLINNLFDYKGIKVSGEHLVNENGKWLKVKQSQFAKSLGNSEHIVYTLGSQNRRILINDILFTDYFDFEEQKTLAA